MINTFRLGADTGLLDTIQARMSASLTSFVAQLVAAGHLDPVIDVGPMKAQASREFNEQVKDFMWDAHGEPLRKVIGMFAPEELAELAETFVSAESLKERVTKPTETVSGPIDVAVITKGDGFIWIKRKHYFDPALNLRFVAQRQREMKE